MFRTVVSVAAGSVAVVALSVSLAGCGFIGASGASHNKPDAFVLRGRVAVPVAAGDTRPDGAACASGLPDIVAGAPVRVTDPDGRPLGDGSLGDGVIARGGSGSSCDFPFRIPGVRGGVANYDVAVGTHPPQRFPAKDLRENAAAIIKITA
ncbi:MAG: hypothetical protein AUI14_19965 [Actinobacteria bacterium 13_2_20CM_2_71_6]|nr:MAG: hypothetical protein AUI14_19965 [Actinobacteria bacterium 13_2_20CM_2_71_6]